MAIDYRDLQHVLEAGGAVTGAAECHGLVVGLSCASEAPGTDGLVAQVLEDAAGEGQAVRDCRESLQALARETREQLGSPDIGFQPLLPEDTSPLAERTVALARWCEGFLYGLGLARSKADVPLTREVAEALADLGEFTRLRAEPGTEEGEGQYAELVEYLRVAVLTIRSERDRDPGGRGDPVH